jgi:hypothetical protein
MCWTRIVTRADRVVLDGVGGEMEEEEREQKRWRGPPGTYSLGIVCGDLGLGARHAHTQAKAMAFVALAAYGSRGGTRAALPWGLSGVRHFVWGLCRCSRL